MNIRQFLTLIAALALAGCDLSSTSQAGTSSETQTSLQAFASLQGLADSSAQIKTGEGSSKAAARMIQSVPDSFGNINIIYDLGLMGMPYHFEISAYRNTPSESPVLPASFEMFERRITPEVDASSRELFASGGRRVSRVGAGLTRNGVHFSWRRLEIEDSSRLHLPSLDNSGLAFGPHEIFVIANRWEIVVPATPTHCDELLVFENNVQIGKMIEKACTGRRPLLDLTGYSVAAPNGRIFKPEPIQAARDWLGDSLGLFWSHPYIDTNGFDLLIPYHWKFFPGTSAIIHQATLIDPPDIYFNGSAVICPLDLGFPSDTGAAIARVQNGAALLGQTSGLGGSTKGGFRYSDSSASVSFNSARLNIPYLLH